MPPLGLFELNPQNQKKTSISRKDHCHKSALPSDQINPGQILWVMPDGSYRIWLGLWLGVHHIHHTLLSFVREGEERSRFHCRIDIGFVELKKWESNRAIGVSKCLYMRVSEA